MVINIKILFAVFIAFIFMNGCLCNKSMICAGNTTYYFINNPVKAYPDKDSILVGDTLWIEYNLSNNLKDTLTNQLINFQNADIGNYLGALHFTGGSVSNPGTIDAADDFIYNLVTGKNDNSNFPQGGMNYLFSESSNGYVLKVAIVPKSQGIYALTISDAPNVSRSNDKCTKASISFIFANTNQHLYFYQNNRPGYIISDYESTHLYCFKVY